eukprot:12480594-Heterocapsa_arctica.AAC.1
MGQRRLHKQEHWCRCRYTPQQSEAPPHQKHCFSAPDVLQGRGGAVRVKNSMLDVCIISAYFPSGACNARKLHIAQLLFLWVLEVVKSLPARCMRILCADVNARVGWCRDENEWRLVEDEAIGDVLPEIECG